MNNGFDAVNYCRGVGLYRSGLVAAQRRANMLQTTELVLHMSDDGETIIDEETIKPTHMPPAGVRHAWR